MGQHALPDIDQIRDRVTLEAISRGDLGTILNIAGVTAPARAPLADIVTDACGRSESRYDALKRRAAWHRATAGVDRVLAVQFSSKWTPAMRAEHDAKAEFHFAQAARIEQQIEGLA